MKSLLIIAAATLGQWLPPERQTRELALWQATGVEFPGGMQFYELPKVSQRLVGIVPYIPENRFGIFDDKYKGKENVNAMYPWAVPSGLHWSPRDQWRKVGAALFTGPVVVRVETIRVENSVRKPGGGFYSQPQPHLTWDFPDGSQFGEMLVRTMPNGTEFVFEIRRYGIHGGDMVNAQAYRAIAEPPGPGRQVELPPGKLADFGLGSSTVTAYPVPAVRPGRLVLSKLTLTADDDSSIVPRGYMGNQRTCTDCHARAGKPTSYGATTIRGAAPVISWHPFRLDTVNTDRMPLLDMRWRLKTTYQGR